MTDQNQADIFPPDREKVATPGSDDPFSGIKVVKNEARAAAELIPIGPQGIYPEKFDQLVDIAKGLSRASISPAHLRGDVWSWVAIIQQAMQWGLTFWTMAKQTYVVKGSVEFMAQTWVTQLHKSGLIEGRLDYEFQGEGDERWVKVSANIRGTGVRTLETPPVARLKPKRNTSGELKGSPLWDEFPDQQLCYYGARAWIRRHTPEVMLSAYDPEEMEQHVGPIDVTPQAAIELKERLKAAQDAAAEESQDREGFRPDVVKSALRDSLLATPILDLCHWTSPVASTFNAASIQTVGDLIERAENLYKPRSRVLAEVKMRLAEKGLAIKKHGKSKLRRIAPRGVR